MNTIKDFTEVITRLQQVYGIPNPPYVTDPYQMVLWENTAYLVNDQRRMSAFVSLFNVVGAKPDVLLSLPLKDLCDLIKDGGMLLAKRAGKILKAAELAREIGVKELARLIHEAPPKTAMRTLKRFPGIGEPGAEKILLFGSVLPTLAPDSNALRVLLRLGYGQESKQYRKSYISVKEMLDPLLPHDFPYLVRAHQLLRKHGLERCKNKAPGCEACPLMTGCAYHSTLSG